MDNLIWDMESPLLDDFNLKYFFNFFNALSLIFFSFEARFCANCTSAEKFAMLITVSGSV